jgi:hypothetical protein
MHLCFALFEGQAENHLYVFSYDLNTHLNFIISFSWSFVCVHFYVYNMVAKSLLSRLYLSCPCFKFLWSQLTNTYIYDQDCVGACHLLHACFYTICLIFCYTSWHFYAFSGTNLLTSRHSASSLFSTVFVFRKSYTGNILGIGRNKFLKSYFSRKLPEIRRGDGVGPWGGHTPGRRGPAPGHAPYVWDHLGPLLTMPLRV